MKINILLPFFLDDPGGGVKVMYQYANQLAERGHDVVIYHSLKTRWMHKRLLSLKFWKLYFLQRFASKVASKRPTWFLLNKSIKSLQVAKVSNHLIRDADIVFSTWWATATEMTELESSKGKKFNLIQDDGTHWPEHKELIIQSYRLPINYLTISKYLQECFSKYTKKMIPLIPNAIDPKQYYIHNPIEDRAKETLIMLYSEADGKGSRYGLDAFKLVLMKHPSLRIKVFGVHSTFPQNLAQNFTYYHKPANLAEIYNESAIFISPSLQEGWGLPPMEAMACGCACVCTRIEGHVDFMDDDTALLVEPRNSRVIADAILKLIEDDDLRIRLAYAGSTRIKDFTWDKNTNELEKLFLAALNEK